jgi:hypothetical protein
MLLVDERCLQPDLVGADRIVPVASVAASRDLDASSQLNVLRRKSPQRLGFTSIDRLVLDAPSPRTVHSVGRILPTPFLGGLHHLYVRV